MSKPTESLKQYWRSLEDADGSHNPPADEFPGQAQTSDPSFVPSPRLARRKFNGLLGASTALAGLTTTGCLRKPVEHILPFAKRPEDTIPGQPVYYATAYQVGHSVLGLLVESQDGRPTKVEGNPRHPSSNGATDVWAQGSVLSLYDPDRCRVPHQHKDGKHVATDWDTVQTELGATIKEFKNKQGEGLALVLPTITSPTYRDLLDQFRQKFAKARIFTHDVAASTNAIAGAELLVGENTRATYHLSGAKVIAAFDADIFQSLQDHVRLQREYAEGRHIGSPGDAANMSRLYAIEPHFTTTGAQADHRLRARAGQVGTILAAVARELLTTHKLRPPPNGDGLADALPKAELDEPTRKFVTALTKDLIAAKGARATSVIVVGERQPAWVHALGLLVNYALGNGGNTVRLRYDDKAFKSEDLAALAAGLTDGSIAQVIALEVNPAYDSPGELGLAKLLAGKLLVHHGSHMDETGKLATWCLPANHYLESWGDVEAADSTISLVQPLIAPLHDSCSSLELLGWIVSDAKIDGYSLVKGFWRTATAGMWSDKLWRRWLHDGVVQGVQRAGGTPAPRDAGPLVAALKSSAADAGDGFEINFHLDPAIADGRAANNAWLQEAPHPMTKLAWDNAAYISIETARKLGVENCDLVEISVAGRTLKAPVWIAPGQAEDTVSLDLGYGREGLGAVATGAGVDAYALQAAGNRWFISGGAVAKAGGRRVVYSTQDHGSLSPGVDPARTRDERTGKYSGPDANPGAEQAKGDFVGEGYPDRPIVRVTTVAGFKAEPEFSQKGDLIKQENLKSLWDHNTHPDFSAPVMTGLQQWGLSIDLNRCTGCGTCTVACQAENNIPVVGRKEIGNGRELHWIRIDRYYTGPKEAPEAVVQPMLCQHCETAPCENVCPVQATAHSPEGLNDMAYNRCIGTRYCANNCPYKVRRFNFFNYNKEPANDHELVRMVKNPDVTVRFRGVIEKCSYCVQRIQEAKIQAHTAGEDLVKDGAIVTACQQVCPSQAITFGDIKDPDSKVSKAKANIRNYGVLTDLNTRPRTTYLGRVRNPNPELA
jgi:Fe-S-cluster-containing dehydrogenase component/anaerobic selenocysteine-containing dehydrogenase